MKRKLIVVGIFLSLAIASVIVVVATRQDMPASTGPAVKITSDGQIVVEPRKGSASPTVVASLPKTNSAPQAAK